VRGQSALRSVERCKVEGNLKDRKKLEISWEWLKEKGI
jgi:hypothetical protein